MRIGRAEFGMTKYHRKDNPLKRFFEISHDKGLCGCHILSVSIFYFTWLGDECYLNPPENEET